MQLAVIAMFAVGLVVGLLGGGGSILAMPLLVQLLDLEPRVAMAFSLALVGLGALVGAVLHATRRNVDMGLAAAFGAVGMSGAVFGGRVSPHVPIRALLAAFIALMVTTAIAMKRGRAAGADASPGSPPARSKGATARLLGAAAVIGTMSGLVGAGGGFLVVPALTMLGGLELRRAIGTSLAVLALQSTAGALASPALRLIPVELALPLVLASLWGTAIGFSLSSRIAVSTLRSAFATLVLLMACGTAAKTLGAGAAGLTAAVSLVALGALRYGRREGREGR